MTILSLILGFILGAGAIAFALQNNELVALTFLGWQFESSLALVFLLAVAAGLILGVLLLIPSILRRSLIIMTLRREQRALEQETQRLRDGITTLEAERVFERPAPRVDI